MADLEAEEADYEQSEREEVLAQEIAEALFKAFPKTYTERGERVRLAKRMIKVGVESPEDAQGFAKNLHNRGRKAVGLDPMDVIVRQMDLQDYVEGR